MSLKNLLLVDEFEGDLDLLLKAVGKKPSTSKDEQKGTKTTKSLF